LQGNLQIDEDFLEASLKKEYNIAHLMEVLKREEFHRKKGVRA
jgi:hypothetical protein